MALSEFEAGVEDVRRALELGYPEPDASDPRSVVFRLGHLWRGSPALNLAHQIRGSLA